MRVEKKSTFWWILQIIPPLIILPLSTMPMDIGTGVFWLAGIIASLISLVSIVKKVIARIRSKTKPPSLINIIRPSLTVFCMFLAIASEKYSLAKAETDAFETAKYVQKICDSDNACPDCIPAWERINGLSMCESYVGGLAKYKVSYTIDKDKKGFSIILRLNIDHRLFFHGGVGKEVRRDNKN